MILCRAEEERDGTETVRARRNTRETTFGFHRSNGNSAISSTHLDERPVGSDDLDDDHHGDADHGGQGQSPAQSDGPLRILVLLVVLQWLVFDQGEDKAALRKTSTRPSEASLRSQYVRRLAGVSRRRLSARSL